MTPGDPLVGGCAKARTWLFVPGDRPERFEKAQLSGADAIICDLEDGVDPANKALAREAVASWLSSGGVGWVRINAIETEWFTDDVGTLGGFDGLLGLIVPKAEDVAAIHALTLRLRTGCEVVALIESARGVRGAYDIAASDAVARLAFGAIDFAADIRAEVADDSLLLARSTLVLASRLADKPPPIDGVTTALKDAAAIEAAVRRAKRLGFGGKLCVHPAQVGPAAAAFGPDREELEWARRTVRAVAESGSGAGAVDGQMVDKPVLERARRILDASTEAPDAPA